LVVVVTIVSGDCCVVGVMLRMRNVFESCVPFWNLSYVI